MKVWKKNLNPGKIYLISLGFVLFLVEMVSLNYFICKFKEGKFFLFKEKNNVNWNEKRLY